MNDLLVTCSDGLLSIARQGKSKKHIHTSVEKKGFCYDENKPLMDNISCILKNLSDSFMHVDIRIGSSQLHLQIPGNHRVDYELNTTSGDVELRDVAAAEVAVNTTSGDVKMELLPGTHTATLKTTSGDVRTNTHAYSTIINTISGDVRSEGQSSQLMINTVSGDLTAREVPSGAMFKTVSGDMLLFIADNAAGILTLNTTSGDATVHLPASLMGRTTAQFSTVSGDKCFCCQEACDDASLKIMARSISGDLTVM